MERKTRKQIATRLWAMWSKIAHTEKILGWSQRYNPFAEKLMELGTDTDIPPTTNRIRLSIKGNSILQTIPKDGSWINPCCKTNDYLDMYLEDSKVTLVHFSLVKKWNGENTTYERIYHRIWKVSYREFKEAFNSCLLNKCDREEFNEKYPLTRVFFDWFTVIL